MTPLAKHLASHLGGRSHAEIAAALGVHRSAVMYWMRGDRVPSHAHLCALCDVLGISGLELLTTITLAEEQIADRAIERWRSS